MSNVSPTAFDTLKAIVGKHIHPTPSHPRRSEIGLAKSL
jgi:hypothetical protein